MPEPQPGTDRPADGGTQATARDPGTDEPSRAPVPPATPATGPDAATTPAADDSTPDEEPTGTAPATDSADPDGAEAAGSGSPSTPHEAAGAAPAGPTLTDPVDDETPGTEIPTPGDHQTADTETVPPQPVDRQTAGTETAVPEPAEERTEAAPDKEGASAEPPVTPARGSAAVPIRPAGSATVPDRAAGSAAVPGRLDPAAETDRPEPTRKAEQPDPTRVAGRPDPTRVESRVEPPAPRWSGSAPVPPPPPRKRSWGESAEPTPLPPVDSPEHLVPVDPWEGVDTTGWDLHSADFPALPPTPPYPTPAAHPHAPVAHPPVAHPHAAHPPVVHPPAALPPPVAVRPVPSPAPVSPPRPAPPRPPKQRRRPAPPPVAPPPGFQPPKGYVAVPVRRRRRWPWVLLLTVACCCGVPIWWAQPLSAQYPASATLPDRMADLRLRQDQRSQATAEELKTEVRQAHLLAEDTFAGIYTTNDGKRVTLFGGTGFRLSPEADADAEIDRLRERYALGDAEAVETGVRGRYERCAVGRADGDAVVVCTSVDHGSLTTGVFTRLSLTDSGRLLNDLRQQVVTPKRS
ncbi:hypothetical protein [Micromonospora sp. MP36]|uniref:hypothetical protein n=1 Tax=Micromonospora sp. MP36 TaxID=2604468 RepID=UPI0011D30577|nr:hypothetical protein [Micromonospora sp. MP36]TYC23743.1 hypothetical protein FXF52_14300 [Micromonospora sp. MP36]